MLAKRSTNPNGENRDAVHRGQEAAEPRWTIVRCARRATNFARLDRGSRAPTNSRGLTRPAPWGRFPLRNSAWRSGRVVEGSGFENRRTERYQGFESLLLRPAKHANRRPIPSIVSRFVDRSRGLQTDAAERARTKAANQGVRRLVHVHRAAANQTPPFATDQLEQLGGGRG